jgi:hypothetical protein
MNGKGTIQIVFAWLMEAIACEVYSGPTIALAVAESWSTPLPISVTPANVSIPRRIASRRP